MTNRFHLASASAALLAVALGPATSWAQDHTDDDTLIPLDAITVTA